MVLLRCRAESISGYDSDARSVLSEGGGYASGYGSGSTSPRQRGRHGGGEGTAGAASSPSGWNVWAKRKVMSEYRGIEDDLKSVDAKSVVSARSSRSVQSVVSSWTQSSSASRRSTWANDYHCWNTNCGLRLPFDDAKFCTFCGAELRRQEAWAKAILPGTPCLERPSTTGQPSLRDLLHASVSIDAAKSRPLSPAVAAAAAAAGTRRSKIMEAAEAAAAGREAVLAQAALAARLHSPHRLKSPARLSSPKLRSPRLIKSPRGRLSSPRLASPRLLHSPRVAAMRAAAAAAAASVGSATGGTGEFETTNGATMFEQWNAAVSGLSVDTSTGNTRQKFLQQQQQQQQRQRQRRAAAGGSGRGTPPGGGSDGYSSRGSSAIVGGIVEGLIYDSGSSRSGSGAHSRNSPHGNRSRSGSDNDLFMGEFGIQRRDEYGDENDAMLHHSFGTDAGELLALAVGDYVALSMSEITLREGVSIHFVTNMTGLSSHFTHNNIINAFDSSLFEHLSGRHSYHFDGRATQCESKSRFSHSRNRCACSARNSEKQLIDHSNNFSKRRRRRRRRR